MISIGIVGGGPAGIMAADLANRAGIKNIEVLEQAGQIGGRIAAVTVPQTASALEDIGGTYRAWFAAHSCSVAVVRPDWYLYGTARNGSELTALLEQLAQSLQRRPVHASA